MNKLTIERKNFLIDLTRHLKAAGNTKYDVKKYSLKNSINKEELEFMMMEYYKLKLMELLNDMLNHVSIDKIEFIVNNHLEEIKNEI